MFQINEKAPPGIPKIIVANKKDLCDNSRVVTVQEGDQLAQKYSTANSRIFFA